MRMKFIYSLMIIQLICIYFLAVEVKTNRDILAQLSKSVLIETIFRKIESSDNKEEKEKYAKELKELLKDGK